MRTVLLHSGGMDSTTLLWLLKSQGQEVICLHFDYGQKHSKELKAATKLASMAGCESHTITIPQTSSSALLDPAVDVPEGHYADSSMKSTVVPGRNLIMGAHAASFAVETRSQNIAMAVHYGDHPIYADCRAVFTKALRDVLSVFDLHPVTLLVLFLNLDKIDIAPFSSVSIGPLRGNLDLL